MVDKEKIDVKSEGLGVSGFTLGIIGIIFAGVYGTIISLIGFIFCMIQQKRYKTKIGKVGLILNIVAIILSIIAILFSIFVLPSLNQASLT